MTTFPYGPTRTHNLTVNRNRRHPLVPPWSEHISALGWRGDPSDLVAAADPDPGRLRRYLAATEPSWMAEAECRKPEHRSVDFFAAARGRAGAAALQVCAACPVLAPCRQWALNPVNPLLDGVAGGMTASARRLTLKARGGKP